MTCSSCCRAVFYREHAAGIYSVPSYVLAEFLVEVPYLIVQATLYSLIVYWCAGCLPVAWWDLPCRQLIACNSMRGAWKRGS